MRSITTTIALFLFAANTFCQTVFLRHDTTIIKASEANWLIHPETKTSVSDKANENTVSKWFLESLKKGKLKATDPITGKVIPANKISTWNMPVDTADTLDKNGNAKYKKYKIIQAEVEPSKISQIRILHNWYLDKSTGKLYSRIKRIELMMEVHSAGMFIGYRPLFRIYY